MSWQSYCPTKIFFGDKTIEANYSVFKDLGSQAFIVTGQGGSARRIGALNDIQSALQRLSIDWELFDQVEANPSIDTVRRGAAIAREFGADFVIGIGGGSPLDAAKAIAVLAHNNISDEQLFNLEFNEVLPIIAVPTTAGTGSEVTPYSILTWPALETKKSIGTPKIYPRAAFLDPSYTAELPCRITADTAVDAYSHALESFLSIKTTPISDLYAREALAILGPELKKLDTEKNLQPVSREALLYGSMLGGMAISTTGTSIPHALGYSLTYFQDIPHGRANGMIMPAYMDFNMRNSSNPKIQEALTVSGFGSQEEFAALMKRLCGPAPICSPEEKDIFITKTLQAKNLVNNIVTPTREDLVQILNNILS